LPSTSVTLPSGTSLPPMFSTASPSWILTVLTWPVAVWFVLGST
jgi:hypothetical protein